MSTWTLWRRIMPLVGLAAVLGAVGGVAHGQPAPLISEVRVEGAGYVSADAVRDAVKDLLKPGQPYSVQKVMEAQQLIMKMGYYDQVTVAPKLVTEGLQVVITVVEKRRIERVIFVGNTALSAQQLLAVVKSHPGRLVNRKLIGEDANLIQEAYKNAGYQCLVPYAEPDNFGVVTFVIDESRIESVKITGLKRTKEWVVRRVINLRAGELFQVSRVAENARRIRDMQLFKDLKVATPPGNLDPQRGVIVEFIVEEEAKTRGVSVALSYQSLDHLVLSLSVQEANFRGRAERATVSVDLLGRTSYDLTYEEPYLDQHNTDMKISLYDTEQRRRFVGGIAISTAEDRFEERRSGGSVNFARPLDPDMHTAATVGFRSERVYSSTFQALRIVSPEGVRTASTSAPSDWWGNTNTRQGNDNPNLYPDVAGPGDTIGPDVVAAPLHPQGRLNSVSLGYTTDFRDSRYNATRGQFSRISTEIAGGFLGSDVSFQKLQLEHRRYYPVRHGTDVIALRALAGISFGDLPLFESFSVGGANSLRGYEEDRFRGNRMFLGTVEYRHPVSDSLSVVGFLDVGDAYGGTFHTVMPGFVLSAEDQSAKPHAAAGVGIRVKTPIGPLRLDFGWGSEGNQAHFSVGEAF